MTRSMGGCGVPITPSGLAEREIDGSLTTEDLHRGLESLAVDVDLGDRRMDTRRTGRRPP